MDETFDVVVVGGGPAGEVAAERAASGGLSVALVESELLGGECSYWACIPSKALLRSIEALAAARRAPGAREAVTGRIDAGAVLAHRDEMVHDYDDTSQREWAEGVGLTVVRGHGRLAGERVVEVSGDAGAVRTLRANRAVVLATGSAPVLPPIDGLADVRPWDSRGATSAKEVPRRLLVLGGGVVASEMAWAWRGLGAEEVTVLVRGDRLLAPEEPFVGETLATAFSEAGIGVQFSTELKALHRSGDGPITATLAGGAELVADELLVATGRKPRTADLGLETVGLEPGKPIAVDDRLRATGVGGDWLHAVGDVNGVALLTHMGKYQGRLLGERLGGRRDLPAWSDTHAVTRVVFTDPQIAAVGLTAATAREQGLDIVVSDADLSDVAGAAELGEGVAGPCRLVADRGRGVLVGATFMGPEAANLLHAATIAIAGEVPLERLHHAVPAFPTLTEVWLGLLAGLES